MTTNAKNLVSELLPCPFCGCEAKRVHNDFLGDLSMAECRSCGASIHESKWNTRAPMLAQAGDAVSESVAWMSSGGDVSRSKLWCDERTGPNSMGPIPLYSHPPHDDGKVARDAERYRFLRECKSNAYYVMAFDPEGDAPCLGGEIMDNAIDAAIKEQRSLSQSTGSHGDDGVIQQ